LVLVEGFYPRILSGERMMKDRHARKRAFTLVELMIASGILLAMLGGFMALMITAIRTQVMSSDYYRATCIARNRVQRARVVEFASLPLMAETVAPVDENGNQSPSGRFRRTTVVTNASGNCSLVTVQVWFPVPNGHLSQQSIDVTTLITSGL
jgi:hypothetical protein